MSDELSILDPRLYNVSPECEKKDDFKSQNNKLACDSLVKKIWKLKEAQLERQKIFQKLKLSSVIIELKEKEAKAIKVCACKSFCRIFHKKHNWKKPASQKIVLKFRSLDTAYPCNTCDKTFENVDCLKLHVKTVHEQVFSREDKMGEVMVMNPSRISGGRLI